MTCRPPPQKPRCLNHLLEATRAAGVRYRICKIRCPMGNSHDLLKTMCVLGSSAPRTDRYPTCMECPLARQCRNMDPNCCERENTTTMGPLFSRSVARPRGHRAKKSYGVYHFPGKAREKGIHHRSERRVYTIDLEKGKKEGLHGGGVFLFFSLSLTIFSGQIRLSCFVSFGLARQIWPSKRYLHAHLQDLQEPCEGHIAFKATSELQRC